MKILHFANSIDFTLYTLRFLAQTATANYAYFRYLAMRGSIFTKASTTCFRPLSIALYASKSLRFGKKSLQREGLPPEIRPSLTFHPTRLSHVQNISLKHYRVGCDSITPFLRCDGVSRVPRYRGVSHCLYVP